MDHCAMAATNVCLVARSLLNSGGLHTHFLCKNTACMCMCACACACMYTCVCARVCVCVFVRVTDYFQVDIFIITFTIYSR